MNNDLSDVTKAQPVSEIAGSELPGTTTVAPNSGSVGNCSGHGHQGCCGNHRQDSAPQAEQGCCGH